MKRYFHDVFLLIILCILFIIFSIVSPTAFFSVDTFTTMAFQLPEFALLALASMVIFVISGLDLSIVSIATLSGISMAYMMNSLEHLGYSTIIVIVLSIIVGIVVSILCGLINGFFVAKVGMPTILTTFATMMLFNGLSLFITKGGTISNFTDKFLWLGNEQLFLIPVPLIILIIVFLISKILLEKTSFGFKLHAIGLNPIATELSGINTQLIKYKAHVLSALFCGLSGIIMCARYNSITADYGSSYLITSIAAALLGNSRRNHGINVFSTLLAVMIIQIISTGFNILGLNRFLLDIIIGLILIVVKTLSYISENNDFKKLMKEIKLWRTSKKIAISGVLIISLTIIGITSFKSAPYEDNNKYKMVVMPKVIGTPYFNTSGDGAKQAAKELNISLIYTGPTTIDSSEQVKILEDLINTNVDCIAIGPNDAAALSPVLKKARNKGIIVMDWDTPAEKGLVDYSVLSVYDDKFSKHIWDLLAEEIGMEGKYAIITGGLAASNLNSWITQGLKYASVAYPDLELVSDRIPSDEKATLAYKRTLEIIQAYPDLDGIIGISVFASLGAAQAINENNLQDSIALVGCAIPDDSKPYILDGSFDGATGWNSYDLGYVAVYAGNALLENGYISKDFSIPNIDNLEINNYEKYIVVQHPPIDFTKENINEYTD